MIFYSDPVSSYPTICWQRTVCVTIIVCFCHYKVQIDVTKCTMFLDCGGKVCENGGTIDLTTCECTCGKAWQLQPTCACELHIVIYTRLLTFSELTILKYIYKLPNSKSNFILSLPNCMQMAKKRFCVLEI